MSKTMIVIAFISGAIAIILALISAILFLCGSDFSGAIGVASTIISVALSLASLGYTYVSGVSTIKLLNTIEDRYDKLAEKIADDLIERNFGKANLEDARRG